MSNARREYLKRYMEMPSSGLPSDYDTHKRKKKKKKKDSSVSTKHIQGISILEDDKYDYVPKQSDSELEDEKPQVVENVFLPNPCQKDEGWIEINSTMKHQSILSMNEDLSPPRRRLDEDLSPPRKRLEDEDLSSPRKRSADEDLSPPRRLGNTYFSPPCRKLGDEDLSSPRRRLENRYLSPPRRLGEKDSPPPRRRLENRYLSPPPRMSGDEDLSPPRRPRDTLEQNGIKSQSGVTSSLGPLNTQFKEPGYVREMPLNAPSEECVNGRDSRGRNLGAYGQMIQQERDCSEYRDEDLEWGTGRLLSKDRGKGYEDVGETEKKRGFHGIQEDDLKLNEKWKKIKVWDDPLEKLIASGVLDDPDEKKSKASKSKQRKWERVFDGWWPPNRFNIAPSYKWDGADRSNGFEAKYFQTMNEARIKEEMKYKYTVYE